MYYNSVLFKSCFLAMASQLTFLSLDLLPPIALNRTDRMVFPKSEWNDCTLLFRMFTCALLAHRTTSESSTCHPQWTFQHPLTSNSQCPPLLFVYLWSVKHLQACDLSCLSECLSFPPSRVSSCSPLVFSSRAPLSGLAPMPSLQPPPLYPSLRPWISALYKPLLHWVSSVFAIICQQVMVTLKETTILWSPQCPQQLLSSCPLFW